MNDNRAGIGIVVCVLAVAVGLAFFWPGGKNPPKSDDGRPPKTANGKDARDAEKSGKSQENSSSGHGTRKPDVAAAVQSDDSTKTASSGGDSESAPPRNEPAVGGLAPDFEWTDDAGRRFGTAHLAGRALLIGFLPENDGEHDAWAGRLNRVIKEIGGYASSGRLQVLAIVRGADGQAASAERLRDAKKNLAFDSPLWQFVTAPRESLDAFWPALLAAAPHAMPAAGTGTGTADRTSDRGDSDAGANVDAKSGGDEPVSEAASGAASETARQLVLVDPQGYVRGLFPSPSSADVARIVGDTLTVMQERVLLIDDLIDPAWLDARQQAQLDAVKKSAVDHDFRFVDRSAESQITFRHRIVDDAGRSLVTAHYDHGNGVAVADVDGDGRLDIYFVNQVGGSQLWKNVGAGRFENLTATAGVALADRIGVAASFGDLDNDGDPDLVVTTVRGGNALFRNDGNGRFTDVTRDAGIEYSGHSSSIELFDYDRDGLLDMLVVNVGKYTTETIATVRNDRFTGPDAAEYRYYTSNGDAFAAHLKPDRAERSLLYHNRGGLKFADVTDAMGLNDLNWTGDASPLDANDDGWPDLYLVNMQGHDAYYENVEGKRFEHKSRELFPFTPWGTMGIKVFDANRDGRLDILLTDMHSDMAKDLDPLHEKEKIPAEAFDLAILATDGKHVRGNALFLKQDDGTYREASQEMGVETYWPWGVSVGDLNADGYDDAFVTAGMNFPFRYTVNSLLLNEQGRRFVDSEFAVGIEPRAARRTAMPWFELDAAGRDVDHPIVRSLRAKRTASAHPVVWGSAGTRSSVVLDVDQDGDLDIVTNEFNARPQVLLSDRSEGKTPVRYLQVRLIGSKSNRDGLGATVRVHAGDDVYVKVHDGQSGYLSQSVIPLYFGLGAHESVDRIEITWPSGQTQKLEGPLEINRQVDVTEP